MMDKKDRPVYMIGVAAELAGMHPQTLRLYEREELIVPGRTAKETRLYSDNDIELLKEIQVMTQKMGLNLAGVKLILEMKKKALEMQKQIKKYQEEMNNLQDKVEDEIQKVHKSYKHEIAPYRQSPIALLKRFGINI
jgi:MerR family transcriptional regulator/heat shock protein HspR